jgi:S-adenosylmethionine:tRNA-ribosyltransferase-isomerase (queuine synthetase)
VKIDRFIQLIIDLHVAVAEFGNESKEADDVREQMDCKEYYDLSGEEHQVINDISAKLNRIHDAYEKRSK